jgi:hypothetical protein
MKPIARICQSGWTPSLEDENKLIATGQAADNLFWLWGRTANEWIENGMERMVVYSRIAKLVSRSSTTIRECYYTWKIFGGTCEDFPEASFCHFNHARRCEDADAVLDYQRLSRCGLDELEARFPIGKEQTEAKTEYKYPFYLKGVIDECVGLPTEITTQVEIHCNAIVKLLTIEETP